MKTIVFLLDETGSMQPHAAETIQSFNKYLKETVAAEDPAEPIFFHLTLFNAGMMEQRHLHVPIRDVPELTAETYQPNHMTPLYDAIGKTIEPILGPALMVILTDGEENASQEFSLPAIKGLIEAKEKDGWAFLYLGSTLEVAAAAMSMGMNAATSTPTSGVRHALRTASLATQDYAQGKILASAQQYANQSATPDDQDPKKTWGGTP